MNSVPPCLTLPIEALSGLLVTMHHDGPQGRSVGTAKLELNVSFRVWTVFNLTAQVSDSLEAMNS